MKGEGIALIFRAMAYYEEIAGIKPREIYLSKQSYDQLLLEMGKPKGVKSWCLLEIFGMLVVIDEDCPARGGYLIWE